MGQDGTGMVEDCEVTSGERKTSWILTVCPSEQCVLRSMRSSVQGAS